MEYLKPNEQRSKVAVLLIILVMITELIMLFSDTLEFQLLHSNFTSEDAEANDSRQQITALLYMAVFIISVVTYIRWFRRAYYNLHCKAETLNYPENAAAYSWFIPFLNWFRPVHIMRELFSETQSFLENNVADYKIRINHSLISIWWSLWIITNILGNIQFRISSDAKTLDDYINLNIFSMVNSLLSIPMAILAILVIKEYSKMESLFFVTNKVGVQTELKSYHLSENNDIEKSEESI